jgi:hypothetical protein
MSMIEFCYLVILLIWCILILNTCILCYTYLNNILYVFTCEMIDSDGYMWNDRLDTDVGIKIYPSIPKPDQSSKRYGMGTPPLALFVKPDKNRCINRRISIPTTPWLLPPFRLVVRPRCAPPDRLRRRLPPPLLSSPPPAGADHTRALSSSCPRSLLHLRVKVRESGSCLDSPLWTNRIKWFLLYSAGIGSVDSAVGLIVVWGCFSLTSGCRHREI